MWDVGTKEVPSVSFERHLQIKSRKHGEQDECSTSHGLYCLFRAKTYGHTPERMESLFICMKG